MITPTRLIQGSTLLGAPAAYYTVPNFPVKVKKTVITRLILNNTTVGMIACTVNLVPSGGAAGVSNAVVTNFPVGAGETRIIHAAEGQVMENGDFISAVGNGVTIIASGMEVTTQ